MCQRRLYAVETKAILVPSGDQRGSTLTPPLLVSGRTAPVASSSRCSSIASRAYRAKTTNRPSGDQSGW